MKAKLIIWIGAILLAGCVSQPPVTPAGSDTPAAMAYTAQPSPPFHTATPTATRTLTLTPSPSLTLIPQVTCTRCGAVISSKTATASPSRTPTQTPSLTLGPEAWKKLPVIPGISAKVAMIYQRGLEAGKNPRAFSKIGDCGSTPAWFLGDFDRGPDFYRLGEYQHLEAVIQEFKGSFERTSLAARSGFNAPSLFVPLWSDRRFCQADEFPLACEYRVHSPAIAFIMLGTNDIWHPDEFEPQMRRIIEFSMDNGVIPILSTKADDMEGNGSINATIARLAFEYEVPLWNFWLAVQSLPDYGLQEDLVHLTWGRNFFDDPDAMEKAWPIRNLTALQMLDAVWRKMTGQRD